MKELGLWGTKMTDAGLGKLVALHELRRLNLANTYVTAAGVAQFGTMEKIEHVNLNFTEISDEETVLLQRNGIPVSKWRGTYPPWVKR